MRSFTTISFALASTALAQILPPVSLPTAGLPTTGLPTAGLPTIGTSLGASLPTGAIPTPTVPTGAAASVAATASAAASSLAASVESDITSAARAANTTIDEARNFTLATAGTTYPALIGGFNTILTQLGAATSAINAALKAGTPAVQRTAVNFHPEACLTADDGATCIKNQVAKLALPNKNAARDDSSFVGGSSLSARQNIPVIFVPEQAYTLTLNFGGYLALQNNLFAVLRAVKPNSAPYVLALRNAILVLAETSDAFALALEGTAGQYADTLRSLQASADAAANAALGFYVT